MCIRDSISGARRVLEIGTLGGYSTIWLARAVGPEGRVVTVEAEADNAAVARASIDAAGVGERVDIRIGRGADVLPTLVGGFDLVFIDADKESNTVYLDWAAKLGHPGTVIVLDNIGREGEIVRADSTDSKVVGTRDALRMLGEDPRFDATALQTVGPRAGTASPSPSWCEPPRRTREVERGRARLGADRRRSTQPFL